MENSKNINQEEKESNMGEQIATKYLPYWPLFLLFALIALAGAYVYLRYATPMYHAAATLIIKDGSRGGSEETKVSEAIDLMSSKKNIENEMEVLQSRSLMEKVVKAMHLYAPVTREGKFKSGDGYTLSPIVVEAQNPDSIIEVLKVNFTYDKGNQTVVLNGKDRYPINQFVNTPYGSLKFSLNRYNFSGANDSKNKMYFSLEDPRNAATNYQGGLKITPNKQSAIIEIGYTDPIPERAVDIINNLITIYEQVTITEKNLSAKNTLSTVSEQMAQVKHDLDSIEKKMQQFRVGSGSVDISMQAGENIRAAGEAQAKIGDVSMRISMLDQVERSVLNAQEGEILAPSTISADPSLAAILSQLQAKQMEYESLSKTLGKKNPALLAIADQINKLRPSILTSIQNTKQSLIASRGSLSATSGGFSSKLAAVPGNEKVMLELSREQQSRASMYQFLQQTKAQAELGIANVSTNSRVVDRALADKAPISPKRKMVYAMAIIGALGLCIAIITLKDAFTGKVKYRSEVEKMTSIPIIGEIAFEKTKSPLVIEKGTRSFVAEEFRKLRISLSFLGIDPQHKKLLLTSSISGEGKSFIAANLAVSISLTGKKVVLVDLDLNNPSLSKILSVEYEEGVTEFLNGEKSPGEIINKLDGQENMYFISAGSLPENPTELLANGKVQSLIDYLENNFDMVIIDTSPSVLVTDAFILSAMCDATLYVIRHNYTPKMLVKRIDENNQVNKFKNPAIVFNGVKTRGVFKNNYGYGYDYVYGNKDRGGKTKKAS